MLREFKLAIEKQIRISQNLKELWGVKFCRGFWSLVFVLKALWLAIKSTKSEQIGSTVMFKGQKCYISNWANSESPTLCANGFYQKNVSRKEIDNIINFTEIYHRFLCGFRFYMINWYDIDINDRIYKKKTNNE